MEKQVDMQSTGPIIEEIDEDKVRIVNLWDILDSGADTHVLALGYYRRGTTMCPPKSW